MIEKIVREANNILAADSEKDKRVIAVGIEINQRFLEYLDDLLNEPQLVHENGVTVAVNGKKIKFASLDDFSNWLAGEMK